MKIQNRILTFLLLCCFTIPIHAKVLIFTYSYNRPDFIEIQHKTFEHFLLDEYEFIVFNDAPQKHMADKINAMCTKLNIKCIRIPQEIHNRPYLKRWPGENYNAPAVRNVNVVQYSLDTVGFDHNDILMLFDSDLFLVKPFSIKNFLNGYHLGGMQLGNGHINYLWHGLAFLDMGTMPNKCTLNFNCGRVNNKPVDAGGHSYYYLKNNPEVKAHYVNYFHSETLRCNRCLRSETIICTHNTQKLKNLKFDDNLIQFLQSAHNVEFYHDASFLHYRGGTNWDKKN